MTILPKAMGKMGLLMKLLIDKELATDGNVANINFNHYRFVYKFPNKIDVYYTAPGKPSVKLGRI